MPRKPKGAPMSRDDEILATIDLYDKIVAEEVAAKTPVRLDGWKEDTARPARRVQINLTVSPVTEELLAMMSREYGHSRGRLVDAMVKAAFKHFTADVEKRAKEDPALAMRVRQMRQSRRFNLDHEDK